MYWYTKYNATSSADRNNAKHDAAFPLVSCSMGWRGCVSARTFSRDAKNKKEQARKHLLRSLNKVCTRIYQVNDYKNQVRIYTRT